MLAMTLLQITGIYDIKKKEKKRKNNLRKFRKKIFDKWLNTWSEIFEIYSLSAELEFKSCEIRLVFDVSEMDNVLEHMIHIGYYSKLL